MGGIQGVRVCWWNCRLGTWRTKWLELQGLLRLQVGGIFSLTCVVVLGRRILLGVVQGVVEHHWARCRI
eukprot:760070-Hanusia_phi.AAC.1